MVAEEQDSGVTGLAFGNVAEGDDGKSFLKEGDGIVFGPDSAAALGMDVRDLFEFERVGNSGFRIDQ